MSRYETKKRVLVIDDSEAIHTDFRRILTPQQRRSRGDIDLLEGAFFGPIPRATTPTEPEFEVDCALGLC